MAPDALHAVLLVAFGLFATFFGYRLFRALVVLAGALLGFVYGPLLWTSFVGVSMAPATALVVTGVTAALFGLLAWLALGVAVFVWGAAAGFALGSALFGGGLWPLLVALAVGGVTLAFERVLIVLATAAVGAWLAVSGALYLLPSLGAWAAAPERLPWLPTGANGVPLALAALLAAVGAAVQFARPRPPARRGR